MFPDRSTSEQFAKCGGWDVRRGAIEVLAEKWPDETTRKLLTERAVHDENSHARRTALEVLAEKWPDETTRKLLTERAVHDHRNIPRRGALAALADKWPDETTRKLLTEGAADSALTARQRVEHCVALGRMHSEFGRIVFTRDVDGYGPYLDPLEPVSRERIERAAKNAGIAADGIHEAVRSFSEHMGWDITRGTKTG